MWLDPAYTRVHTLFMHACIIANDLRKEDLSMSAGPTAFWVDRGYDREYASDGVFLTDGDLLSE